MCAHHKVGSAAHATAHKQPPFPALPFLPDFPVSRSKHRFFVITAALLGVCGVMLTRHTELAAVQFHVNHAQQEAPTLEADLANPRTPPNSLSNLTSAMGHRKSQPPYPSWWNDARALPDAQPIFIHIPKTGGVSIEDLADQAGHVTGACLVQTFGDLALPYPLAKGYLMEPFHTPPARFVPFSFTVVRNPYTRMVSEFNWVSLYDPVKAAEIAAGRWTFNCDDFQGFVKDRLEGLAGSALFQCLKEEGFAQEGYETCDAKHLGAISDSHALPQWLFAKKAERVFKYEDFEGVVWPFLRRTGVVQQTQTSQKINSAGGVGQNDVGQTAAKCWPLMSSAVLSEFVTFYSMDFDHLGYSAKALGEEPAAAPATAALALADNVGGSGVTASTEGGASVSSSAALDTDPSNSLSEASKAEARSALIHVDVVGFDFEQLRAPIALDTGGLGEMAAAEGGGGVHDGQTARMGMLEKEGRTTPRCIRQDEVRELGAGEELEWTSPGWAVVEGVLRRAVFKSQALTEGIKSSVRDTGDALAGLRGEGEVATALDSAKRARDLAETAARDPLGEAGDRAFAAAAAAAAEAEETIKVAGKALLEDSQKTSTPGDGLKNQLSSRFAVEFAVEAAEVRRAIEEAVATRLARADQLSDVP